LFAILFFARDRFFLKGRQNFSVVFCSERADGGCGHYFLLLAGKKWKGVQGGGKLFARSPELGDGFLDTQPKLTKPLTRGGDIW